MEPNWLGPYRIHEVLNKGTFRLSQVEDGKKVLAQLYSMTRLKLYHQRDILGDNSLPTDDDPPQSNPQKQAQSDPQKQAPQSTQSDL